MAYISNFEYCRIFTHADFSWCQYTTKKEKWRIWKGVSSPLSVRHVMLHLYLCLLFSVPDIVLWHVRFNKYFFRLLIRMILELKSFHFHLQKVQHHHFIEDRGTDKISPYFWISVILEEEIRSKHFKMVLVHSFWQLAFVMRL